MDYKQIRFTFLKIIVILLILVACVPTDQSSSADTISTTSTPEPYPPWLTNWLEKPTCTPPCWENIIPGVSTRASAKVALSSVTGVSNTEEYEVIPYGDIIHWHRGSIYFDDKDIVQEISLDTWYLGLSLGELTVIYGDPQKVVIRQWQSGPTVIDLLYIELGMAVTLFLEELGNPPDNIRVSITENVEIQGILFFTKDFNYYYENEVIFNPLHEYEWKGYGEYPRKLP